MYPPRLASRVALAACTALLSPSALALDFRSVADNAAILYDGPSARAPKLYVVSRGYPLEVILAVESWVKVRDAQGSFAWVEAKHLADKRTVLVKVPVADVRVKPEDGAPVAFQAQQNVLLDFVSVSGGWIQVRHRDGAVGFVRAQQVWGA
jgi:SH3-like domain-containing protein